MSPTDCQQGGNVRRPWVPTSRDMMKGVQGHMGKGKGWLQESCHFNVVK